MSAWLRLDINEFQQAIAQYVAVTKKDSAEAINRQARNFAIKCIAYSKPAKGAAAIKAIQNEPWWPKIVSKVIAKQAGQQAASKAFQAQWSKLASTSRKMSKEEKSYARLAKSTSKQLLAKRTSAISFLRFFFRSLAQKMTAYAKGGSVPGGKSFTGFDIKIQPATPGRLTVKMDNAYKYKNRGSKSASGAELLLQKSMSVALPATVEDMKKYTSDQLKKRATQYSGRK